MPAPFGSGQPRQTLLLALSTAILVLQLANALGLIVPLGVGGCAAAIVLVAKDRLPGARSALWLLAVPLFATLSTLWSSNPMTTSYYAIQLDLTIATAFLMFACLNLRQFILAAFAAGLIVCLMSVINGTKGPSVTGPVLVGLVGSKNSMASCANLALFAGAAVLFDGRQPPFARVAALASVPLSIYIVATTNAATIIILSVVMPLLMLMFACIHLVPRSWRLLVILLLAVLATTMILAVPQSGGGVQQFVFKTFNKDPTLTGRTYLWQVAGQWITERPILGWGYKARWFSGSSGAIGMLHSVGLTDPRIFSMHETFLETWVDLGLVGLMLVIATIAVATAGSIWRAIVDGGADWIFAATLMISMVIRAFGETYFVPFYPYGTIIVALAGFAVLERARAGAGAAGGHGWRRTGRVRQDAIVAST